MTKIQKTIKYLAIIFAFGLIIAIFSGIINGVFSIFNLFYDEEEGTNIYEEVKLSNNITSLDIDLNLTNLDIKSSDSFKILNESSNVTYKVDGSTLKVKEKSHLFNNKKVNKVTIYINDKTFDDVNIELDAGKSNIENLRSNNLSLELDAGKLALNNISINSITDIKVDAGSLSINDSTFNNLSLELDAGSIYMGSILNGSSKIDLGLGKFELNLLNSLDNYTIKFDKDVVKGTINGSEIINNIYGSGPSYIEIKESLGTLNINTLTNE